MVGEVALAVVLAIAAGLLGRSFYQRMRGDPGFSQQALTFRVDLASEEYNDPAARRVGFYDRLLPRLEALPGVASAGANWRLSISQPGAFQLLEIEGVPEQEGSPRFVYWRSAAGDYPGAMGIPLLTGRLLSARDVTDSEPVCLINRTMAERYWPDGGAVGARIRNSIDDETWITIVGVVGDVKHNDLDQPVEPLLYRPYAQVPPFIRICRWSCVPRLRRPWRRRP